jgi:methyl-accepting chemotaxis protein
MFGEAKKLLNRLLFRVTDISEVVDEIDEAVGTQRKALDDIRTWVELLADTKADAVSEEFERLLESHISAKQKLTNKALVALVHQAVLNTAK